MDPLSSQQPGRWRSAEDANALVHKVVALDGSLRKIYARAANFEEMARRAVECPELNLETVDAFCTSIAAAEGSNVHSTMLVKLIDALEGFISYAIARDHAYVSAVSAAADRIASGGKN